MHCGSIEFPCVYFLFQRKASNCGVELALADCVRQLGHAVGRRSKEGGLDCVRNGNRSLLKHL